MNRPGGGVGAGEVASKRLHLGRVSMTCSTPIPQKGQRGVTGSTETERAARSVASGAGLGGLAGGATSWARACTRSGFREGLKRP